MLRHQPADDLAQKLRRFTDGDVVVFNLPVEPRDEALQRPVAGIAKRQYMLVQRVDKIGFFRL